MTFLVSPLCANLEARIQAIAERAQKASSRPRVVSLEWLDPLMLGGTWMPELISLAGGTPVGVSVGKAAPTITSEELTKLAPEVVLIKPCGFTIERTLIERDLIERAVVSFVNASSRVYITDGNAFFNRLINFLFGSNYRDALVMYRGFRGRSACRCTAHSPEPADGFASRGCAWLPRHRR